MSIASLIRDMAAAGATPEAIAIAVEAIEAIEQIELERKARDAAKTRLYRARGGGKIPDDLRYEILARDNYECQECSSVDYLQIDHIHPVSKGGETTRDNLQVLCRTCNARKRDRVRKEVQRNSTEIPRNSSDKVSPLAPPDKEVPTPLEITPPYIPPSKHVSDSARETEFSQFWEIYPHKVGKRAAENAFSQSRKRDSFESIMAGLRRYVAKTDDRPWCNPSTFLNQDRWLDAPSDAPPQRNSHAPPRKPNAFEAYDEISRLKGWKNESGILPSTDENVERVSSVSDGPSGIVVDLRRGHDWRS